MLRYVLPIIITVLTGFASKFSFDRVPQGSLGIKLCFGKVVTHSMRLPDGRFEIVPKIMYPGFRFMIPGVHQIRHLHVLTCTIQTPRFTIRFKDRTSYDVESAVTFSIQPMTGVLFALAEVGNFHEWILVNFQARLTYLLAQLQQAEDLPDIDSLLVADIQDHIGPDRISVQQVLITMFSPTTMTQLGELVNSTEPAALLDRAAKVLQLVPPQSDGSFTG